MATALIGAGAASGAMAAQLSGRFGGSSSPTDHATQASIAGAVKSAVITANAALSSPMADADNASIATLIQACTFAVLDGRPLTSTTAADYATIAASIVAAAKQAVAQL